MRAALPGRVVDRRRADQERGDRRQTPPGAIVDRRTAAPERIDAGGALARRVVRDARSPAHRIDVRDGPAGGIVDSALALADENAALKTNSVCPRRLRMRSPVRASQSCADFTPPAVTT